MNCYVKTSEEMISQVEESFTDTEVIQLYGQNKCGKLSINQSRKTFLTHSNL